MRDPETGRCTCCGRLDACDCTGKPGCCPDPSPVPVLLAVAGGVRQIVARRARGRGW